ncbi:hypothetical protein D3C74_282250 [compost metagenome]
METKTLPVAIEFQEHWTKELENYRIHASFGMSRFGNGKVYLYVTYPFKGNSEVGEVLRRAGWELSINKFSGVYRQLDGSSTKGMLTQYRIQVDPSSWKNG